MQNCDRLDGDVEIKIRNMFWSMCLKSIWSAEFWINSSKGTKKVAKPQLFAKVKSLQNMTEIIMDFSPYDQKSSM